MKSPQKASFGPETCEIEPKGAICGIRRTGYLPEDSPRRFFPEDLTKSLVSGLWFLSPEAGEPSGRFRGNPNGPGAVQPFKTLYKNPLEIPKGIPS